MNVLLYVFLVNEAARRRPRFFSMSSSSPRLGLAHVLTRPTAIALALLACPCTALQTHAPLLTTSRAAPAWADVVTPLPATHLRRGRFVAGIRMPAEGSSMALLPAGCHLRRSRFSAGGLRMQAEVDRPPSANASFNPIAVGVFAQVRSHNAT